MRCKHFSIKLHFPIKLHLHIKLINIANIFENHSIVIYCLYLIVVYTNWKGIAT